jgi:hypothetical protein
MLNNDQLVAVKDKVVNENVRLIIAVKSVVEDFVGSPENMAVVRNQLFEAYPEVKSVVRKLNLECKVRVLENKKNKLQTNMETLEDVEISLIIVINFINCCFAYTMTILSQINHVICCWCSYRRRCNHTR